MRNAVSCLLFLVLATSALAVPPPPDDGDGVLCVLTAADAPADNFINGVGATTPFTVYFVLYHPTLPSGLLAACDFGWDFSPDPGHFVIDFSAPVSFINIGTDHDPIIGYGSGVPMSNDHVVICSITLAFLSAPGVTNLYLRPNNLNPSLPGQMAYIDLADAGVLQSMVPYSANDAFTSPVFGVNSQPVAAAPSSWGHVKALFD